jgi:hypothetical protein
MGTSSTVVSPASGGKLSSDPSLTSSEILRRLRERNGSNVDILKSINAISKDGFANGTVTFLFELSGSSIESMMHHLNRISFNMKRGLDVRELQAISKGEGGGLFTSSYAILLFMSGSDMRTPSLLKELGITGSRISELAQSKFHNDLGKMHEWIMGKTEGWLIRDAHTQG